MRDPFDPNELLTDAEIRKPVRIPLNDSATLHAWVDGDLGPFFSRWMWVAHFDERGMLYAARQEQQSKRVYAGLIVKRTRIYMHREVLRITKKRRPTKDHVLVDHRDGDTVLNTRSNLRWATYSMNRVNQRAQPIRYDSQAGV